MHVKSKVSDMGKGKKLESHENSTSYYDNDIDMSDMESGDYFSNYVLHSAYSVWNWIYGFMIWSF